MVNPFYVHQVLNNPKYTKTTIKQPYDTKIHGNCLNCVYLDDVDCSSPEYAMPIYICQEHPAYENLLSFPFKKNMKCFKGRIK